MAVRIIITFNEQPSIDDTIDFNSTITEIFKAGRTGAGEIEIGADLDATIVNTQQAILSDYFPAFAIVSSINGNSIQFDFPNEQPGFFETEINSNAITFQEFNGYFPYFVSIYDNRVDNFELVILGKEWDFNQENIKATGVLSYKDVDNILEPIRGAQLDITIDANIAKPFNLFLDFRELDFKAKLYRNGNLLFEGFINPEGVQQNYTSINWKANLVAVDNLGALKNIEHPYTNEVPSEFVMMHLALKKTGLDLPIAFYDDINQNVKNGLVTVPYLTKLEDPINERLIEPDTFKNDNDRFANCEDVLLDILNKYNAIIVQQSISYINIDTGQEEFMLCWLFARVASMSRPISNLNSPYKIKKITGYTDTDGVLFPNVLDYNYKFGIPFRRLGTDGFDTQFLPNDAIHKNKNQLIRQERALQAFRFVHEWISKGSILEDFGYDLFELLNLPLTDDYFFDFVSLNRPQWIGYSILQTITFNPTTPIEDQALGTGRFVKLPTINLPIGARTYKISGNGSFFNTNQNNFTIYGAIHFMVLHTDLNGNRYYLQRPPSDLGNYTIDPLFIPSESKFDQATWVKDTDIEPDELGNLSILNVSNILFSYFGNNEALTDFDSTFPPTLTSGGTIDIYFSPLYIRSRLLNVVTQQIAETFRFSMENFNFEILDPPELGEGNYYDAENSQDISSKIGDPIEIINADDKSDIFLNGIKRGYDEKINYPYWTAFWSLDPRVTDILELMSIERIKLLSKSQNIFSGDIHGYLPYFARLTNTAYPTDPETGTVYMVFTKWVYDTADNTISAEMRECKLLNVSIDFEKSVIFEDEDKKLKR